MYSFTIFKKLHISCHFVLKLLVFTYFWNKASGAVCSSTYTTYHKVCDIDIFGIKYGCRNVGRDHTNYFCCAGWGGGGCGTPICSGGVGACNNGGTCQSPGECSCPITAYPPNCDLCTQIANCNSAYTYCNSSTNQWCGKCSYTFYNHTDNNGQDMAAYRRISSQGYDNRVCEQLCSWRPDSSQCYPGTCPSTTSTCTCASGYGGTNCLNIIDTPVISSCALQLSLMTRHTELERCDNTSSNRVYYVKYAFNTWSNNWTTFFYGPNVPKPYYVNSFNVGIVRARSAVSVIRGNTVIYSATVDCSGSATSATPDKGIHNCFNAATINITFVHGDNLVLQTMSTNGGQLLVKNYDSGVYLGDRTKTYIGSETVYTTTFVYDFAPPIHCINTVQCKSTMLNVGSSFTKNGTVVVKWSGWSDDSSGISYYEVKLFKMVPAGNVLSYLGTQPVGSKVVYNSNDTLSTIFTVTEAGTYAVLLGVHDIVDNLRYSRRFFVFDNQLLITTSSTVNQQIFVQNAVQNASYRWIASLNDQMTVVWKNHFWNYVHLQLHVHLAIEDQAISFDPGYEELVGQPPDIRSTASIPHVNGIIKYHVAYQTYTQSGYSKGNSSTFTNVPDFQLETMSLNISRTDGDAITIWIKATDAMSNTVVDSCTVYVDSSPPLMETQNIVSTAEMYGNLTTESMQEPEHMMLNIMAHDLHSGISEIRWRLSHLPDKIQVDGRLTPVTFKNGSSVTSTSSFYCILSGDCFMRSLPVPINMGSIIKVLDKAGISFSGNYSIDIMVSNGALLTTTRTIQFTFDVVRCPAGEQILQGNCTPCPRGQFKQEGVFFCRSCPSGMTTAHIGTRNAGGCFIEPHLKVTSVYPQYGPRAGYTSVTVKGDGFHQVPGSVWFISSDLQHRNSCDIMLWMNQVVVFRTFSLPNDSGGVIFWVILRQDQKWELNTTVQFTYKPDPVVLDLYPRKAFTTGGTTVTVIGENMNATAQPITLIQAEVRTPTADGGYVITKTSAFQSEDSTLVNDTMLLVKTPSIAGIPANSTNASEPLNSIELEFFIGFKFDGVTKFTNLSETKPQLGQIQIFTDPSFNCPANENLKIQSDHNELIQVQGERMLIAADQHDYRVHVGDGVCRIMQMSDNTITCQPPPRKPSYKQVYKNPPLVVVIGNHEFYLCEVEYPQTTDTIAIAVGVSLSLAALIALVPLIYVVRKRHIMSRYKPKNLSLKVITGMFHRKTSTGVNAYAMATGQLVKDGIEDYDTPADSDLTQNPNSGNAYSDMRDAGNRNGRQNGSGLSEGNSGVYNLASDYDCIEESKRHEQIPKYGTGVSDGSSTMTAIKHGSCLDGRSDEGGYMEVS